MIFQNSKVILKQLKHFIPLNQYLFSNQVLKPLANKMHYGENDVVVLPPSEYWALRVNLHVRTAKEALKYWPSFFDFGDEYSYDAQKVDDDTYIFIAYNPSAILKKWDIFPANKSSVQITFAQYVFGETTDPIKVDNRHFYVVDEGIVIEIDSNYLQNDHYIDIADALDNIHTDYSVITLKKPISSELTAKTYRMTIGILLLILLNLTVDTYQTYKSSRDIEVQRQQLIDESKLPETSIERLAIVASLERKNSIQHKIREQCFKLKSVPIRDSSSTQIKEKSPLTRVNVPNVSGLDGIVFIPGSKPGEANRLVVEGVQNLPTISHQSEGLKELSFDGKMLKLVVLTSEPERLKNEFVKHFRNIRTDYHNSTLEIRLK